MKLPRAHHLSPEQLAAQLLMPKLNIDAIHRDDAELARILKFAQSFGVGGFILFGGDVFEVRYWIERLQAASRIPLLIGADLERGVGGLFSRGTIFPHQLAWGAGASPADIQSVAAIIASESRAIGVNTIFAPALDLVSDAENPIINIRGFHRNAEKVAEFARIFIAELQAGGLLSVAKHFPGHGAVSADSHISPTKIKKSLPELQREDLLPFAAATDAGVRGVMTGHLQLNENPLPATFRADLLRDLLRGEMKFNHLIFSDALDMGAISGRYSALEQISLGLSAGLDVFLMPEKFFLFHRLLADIIRDDENLHQSALAAADRILAAKKWLHKIAPNISRAGKLNKYLNQPASEKFAGRLAGQSITCLQKSARFPLDLKNQKNCLHVVFTDFPVSETPLVDFRRRMNAFYQNCETLENPTPARIEKREIQTPDVVVLSLYARTFAGHRSDFHWRNIREIVSRLHSLDAPLVLFIFGNPFIYQKISKKNQFAATFLAYSYVKHSQIAAFNALISAIDVRGKLPIELSGREESIQLPAQTALRNSAAQIPLPQSAALIENAITDKVFPGAVLAVVRENMLIFESGFGRFDYDEEIPRKANGRKKNGNPPVTSQTRFDLASLTKALATAPAILQLAHEGALCLEDSLEKFYGGIKNKEIAAITISDLLAHRSGLPAHRPFYENCKSKNEVVGQILGGDLDYSAGESAVYSDLGFILLGDIIERVSGMHISEYCFRRLFAEMELPTLQFNPSENRRLFPPTGWDEYRQSIIQGEVNDANGALLGGAAGHAGLFGAARDVAAIARLFLNGGIYGRRRFFSIDLAAQSTRRASGAIGSHVLGWDTPSGRKSSAGNLISRNGFGHLAFTGPSVWCDPEKQIIIVFLCNRSHPSWQNEKIREFRPVLHNAIFNEIKRG